MIQPIVCDVNCLWLSNHVTHNWRYDNSGQCCEWRHNGSSMTMATPASATFVMGTSLSWIHIRNITKTKTNSIFKESYCQVHLHLYTDPSKGLGRFGSVKAVASPEFGVNNTVRNYEFGVNNIGRLRFWCWPIKLKSTSYGAVTVTTCKCNLMSRSNHNMSHTIDALFRILATHINQFRSWTRIFF